MKTLLLNDTSAYHYGCKAVISTIKYDDSIKTTESISAIDYAKYSIVILNGEGTLHDDAPNAIKFLQALEKAQESGCQTYVINSVWQRMSQRYADILKSCAKIIVREQLSQNALMQQGVVSTVRPDRSIYVDVPYQQYASVPIYEGQYFFNYKPIGRFPRIDIFSESWDVIVNKLRHADLLLTNRHHEAYAAIKANCKFIALPSNTHKIEGIFTTAGVEPINSYSQILDVLSGKFNKQYDKLFEHYNQESRTPYIW